MERLPHPQVEPLYQETARLLYRLGLLAIQAEEHKIAYRHFKDATEYDPTQALYWANWGVTCKKLGQTLEAEMGYRQALALDPTLVDARRYLLQILIAGNRDVEQAEQFKLLLEAQPNEPGLWVDFGVLLSRLNRFEESKAAFAQALALKPDYADAGLNLSMMELLFGEYEQGWKHYAFRLHPQSSVASKFSSPPHGRPHWQGESLIGKTILLWPEQGFGDQIQFCRYAKNLKEAGAQVIVGSKPELFSLMQSLPWADRVCADLRELSAEQYDYWAFPMSLPEHFETTLDTIPLPDRYLSPDPERVQVWAARLAPYAGKRKIGLVWAGRPTHGNDAQRSLSLAQCAPLAQASNTVFFSLQKGDKAAELAHPPQGMQLVACGDAIQDFADSAALLSQLDLLITVDSSPAHLAGALGVPVWVLIPANPDFRWLIDRTDTPWYDSMTLFRQKKLGQWQPVIEAMAQKLTQPQRLGIGWQISELHGWGIFGINVVRHLRKTQRLEPVLLDEPVLDERSTEELAPLCTAWEQLKKQVQQLPPHSVGKLDNTVVIHGFGNRFQGPGRKSQLKGVRNAGFIFFEDNIFSEDDLAFARQFDVLIAGSSWNQRLLKAWGFSDARYVMQGVDIERFQPRPKTGKFAGRFVIYSGGKLEYRKGQDLVVMAFKLFHARHPEALLLTTWHNPWPHTSSNIANSPHQLGWPGVENNQLAMHAWLRRCGLPEGSFVDAGLVNNQDIPNLLREADVGLFPNRAEGGTNLVAMEAMASGLPVILSANTGHLDLFNPLEKTAYALERQTLTPNGIQQDWGESDVEEIVEVLESTYADRQSAQKVGHAARHFMEAHAWAHQTERLLGEVL